MVEQVLLNLARNAMQAMDPPARPTGAVLDRCAVRAASEHSPRWAGVFVADHGPGIAPTKWRSSCSRRFSPPRPKAWGWA
jgi:two-component system sensor histidine kinase DctS